MASFDVRVVDAGGKGVRGVRVMLSFTDPLRGHTSAERTDGDGHAGFDGYEEGEVKVFVEGVNHGRFQYRNGASVTVTR